MLKALLIGTAMSSGSAPFDRTCLEATRDWLLAPGRINSETRCMWFKFYVTWRF